MRGHQRVDATLEVTLESESNFFSGFATNISEGGIFVATHSLQPVRSRLCVALSLPNHPEPFEVQCEVCWLREYNDMIPDMTPGMGVRFLELEDSSEAWGAISEFCRDLREPLFHD